VGDAKHYARLACENYLICRGADSPCTLRLHGYMMNPESHAASKTAKQYADSVRENIEVCFPSTFFPLGWVLRDELFWEELLVVI